MLIVLYASRTNEGCCCYMQNRKATIKDVAQMAGVSIATVSHVLNKTRYVSPETQLRVLDVIEKIGYVYNNAGRMLRNNRTQLVGVIVPDIANSFFSITFKKIESILNRNGYKMLLCHSGDDPEKERQQLLSFGAGRVDGILLAPASPTFDYSTLPMYQEYPFVFFDREPKMAEYCGVFFNLHDAVQTATEELINAGHRRIACILGITRFSTTMFRLKGFQDALIKHNLPVDENLIFSCPTTRTEGYQKMKQILEQTDCTAVVCLNAFQAKGAVHYLNENNIDIPGRMSIITVASSDWYEMTRPMLTAIVSPVDELGEKAADLMLRRLNGEDVNNKRFYLNAPLTKRSSY